MDDLITVASLVNINKPQDIVQEVADAITRWPKFAKEAGLGESRIKEVQNSHRQIEFETPGSSGINPP